MKTNELLGGVDVLIFRWEQKLETGVELVDQQHKKMIEIANQFFIRYKCGEKTASIRECLLFLQRYIMYHFQSEEAYQAKCNYPRYQVHRAQHNGIATEVKFLSVRLEASSYGRIETEQFYQFLTNWIKLHILVEDIAFATYYKAFIQEHPEIE